MMRKILLFTVLIMCCWIGNLYGQNTITLSTTSNSLTWSPRKVVNIGNVLSWEASNALIGTITANSDDPTFDFSANDGSPISITITTTDNFGGLTDFEVYSLLISDIDVSSAVELNNLHIGNNQISSLDISALVNLDQLRVSPNNLTSLDISNNPLLTEVSVQNNSLPSSELDNLIGLLDTFGLSNGILNIGGNEGLTLSALPAYNNLVSKGWTIDVSAPGPPIIETITFTTTSNSATWSPRKISNIGNMLQWEATNALIGTLTQKANDPTFDFSANDGSPINITVTSNDGFAGLIGVEVYSLLISDLEVSAASELTNLHIGNNQVTTIDLSALVNLTRFRASPNSLSSIDISANPLLTEVSVQNNNLSSVELDALVNQLDAYGLTSGSLNVGGNEGLTQAAQPAYDNLVNKGWSIDVAAPGPPIIETITLTTTSSSATWSPRKITNIGNILEWEASNALIGTLTQTANDPTFDFSANDGTPISITVTSNDGFAGLTAFEMYSLLISQLNLDAATELTNVHIGNNQISNLDLSNLVNLSRLRASPNLLSVIDISNNPLLTEVSVQNNELPSTELNAIVNQLDAFGLSGGILNVGGNQGLTPAAQPAYDNLIAKNWVIDVPAPGPPVIETITLTTTSSSATWSPRKITNIGNVLQWEATNALIGTLTQTANDPTFDFSANDGSPINITVTSTDGFLGFTEFEMYSLLITDLVLDSATELTNVHIGNNQLSSIDLSTLINLTRFRASPNTLVNLDISNNPLLTEVSVQNNQLPSVDLNTIVNQLDAFGLSNGILGISGNAGSLTASAIDGYNNLIAKGWTIDVAPPSPAVSMTLTTTSASATWSPRKVTNIGEVLTWEATNALIGTLSEVNNNPTFDFSANDGSSISITVTSNDGFGGLTELELYSLLISAIDPSPAVELTNLHLGNNQLTTVDISTLTNLTRFRGSPNSLTTLDISTNQLLTEVSVQNNSLPTADLDAIVNNLDGFGLSNGILNISGNAGDLSMAAQPGYDNLITKGWTIDVAAPTPPGTLTIVTTSNSATWSPRKVVNSGNDLTWEATNALIGTLTQTANVPVFDFSANDGSPINITVTSTDDFIGLIELEVYSLNITDIDVTAAVELGRLHVGNNQLTAVDISTLTKLTRFRGSPNSLTALDISNNPLLTEVSVQNNTLPSVDLDAIVNQLDVFGLSNGILNISGNAGNLTIAAQPAYDNLIIKGWTIDVSAPLPPGPQINITGNGLDISSSAAAIPENGSDFGETTLGNPVTNQFVIENNGDEALVISLFVSTSAEFPITLQPSSLTIDPGLSEVFEVSFTPVSLGTKAGSILVASNDADTPAFVLNLAGDAVEVLSNQIMISQYYQGFSGTDNWIEVTNISGADLPAGTYFLALYDHTVARTGIIESTAPTQSVPIPAIPAGETVLFKNAAASLPLAGNIGIAPQIGTDVCTFDGDDLILISTTSDDTSYNFRVDIMGNISSGPSVSPDPWGVNNAYIKGGCSSEIAHKTFDLADWSFILLEDVDNAISDRNVALGTQVVGPTEFDGTNWSNLEPDQSRTAVISTSFTGAQSTFVACNLTISSGADVVYDSNGVTSNSIVIYGDLIVDGSLTIGDTESLVAYNPDASLGVITKIEKSNDLIDINDMTYWSSPVQGSQLATIFAGSDPARIFEFRAGEVNPLYAGTNYKYWWNASGAMGKAIGYAAPGASTGVQTLSFTGIPNNGTITLNAFFSGTVDTGTANENFNLIGNPYPAAIDIQRILEDNGSINEIALWTHDTSPDPITGEYDDADYVYYSTSGPSTPGVTENIASGQGFMARTVAATGGIAFNDSYKLIGRNDQFFKSTDSKKQIASDENGDKVWLRLRYGTEKNDILIGFMEEATDGYDMYYDAIGNLYNDYISLIEKNTKFYSKIDNDKFVIQGLGQFVDRKNIDLGFDTKKAGWFKMSINKTQGALSDADIYLVDTYLNIKHDLNKGDYEFQADKAGEFSDRFRLEFVNKAALDLDKVVDADVFRVSNDFDIMNVFSGKVVNEIKVYDLLGRMIIHELPKQTSFQLNTSTVKVGTVMLIEARLEDGSMLNTKSIKY